MPLAEARERAEKVYYLRAVAGLPWRQIAAETGYSSVGGAQRAYQRHLERNELPNGKATLAEILERKRFRQGVTTKGISTALQNGDLSALASLLRASVADDTELAKLFGLNAPERHQVQAVVATTTTDLLDQLEAKFSNVIDGEVAEQ
ncbi:hypothetical protein GPOL_c31940 [Gordonia polyisoprenivorans VH2]|uniref:Uncharacterized protein n=2 Tax=Gordonia polyisoprenivorans TaxID=84595 RepID=H6MX91_GORPV|nr:hypothetical protein GPOL_c31940 [Gordonia polyisoprenivorans VH2]